MDTSSIWSNDKNDTKRQSSNTATTSILNNDIKTYQTENEWGDFSDYSFSSTKNNTNLSDLDFFQSSNFESSKSSNLNSNLAHNEWSDFPTTSHTFEDTASNIWGSQNKTTTADLPLSDNYRSTNNISEFVIPSKSFEVDNNTSELPNNVAQENIHTSSIEVHIPSSEPDFPTSSKTEASTNFGFKAVELNNEEEFDDEFQDFTKPQIDFISNKLDSVDFYTENTKHLNDNHEELHQSNQFVIEDEEFDDFHDFTNKGHNTQDNWVTSIPNTSQYNKEKISAKTEILNQLDSICTSDIQMDSKNTITSVEEVYPHLNITNYNIQNVHFPNNLDDSTDQNTRNLIKKIIQPKHNTIFNWENSSIQKKYLAAYGLTSIIIERRQKPKAIPPPKVWNFGANSTNSRHKKSPSSKSFIPLEQANFLNQRSSQLDQTSKSKPSILQMENLLSDFEPFNVAHLEVNSSTSISNISEPILPNIIQSPTTIKNTSETPAINITNTSNSRSQSDNLIEDFEFSPSKSPKNMLSSFPPLIPPPP